VSKASISAYESVNSDRVELLLILKKADLLIHHIGLAFKASLGDGGGNRFYADPMVTVLSAHLLCHYITRNHQFRDYEDGLSQQ
jgi:AraC family transcriptional regulator